MQIALLGPLEVRADDGTPVEVTGARLRTLLILLALEPGRVVTTGHLIDGVWGDAPPAGAANALQALVSRLRRALPEPAAIAARPTGYLLDLPPEQVDAVRFERLVAHSRDAADPREALRTALALWRGPALADVAAADFAQAPVARLAELRLTATEQRIEADLARQATAGLVAELEELVAAHPLRETLVGRLMRALHAVGRTSAALTLYEQTRRRLADELGADPSPALAALHTTLLRNEAPQPTQGGRRTNLRAWLTSFVGRGPDADQVADLLAAHRLATLTGPGGAGKTRLAIEAARPLLDRMPDGVWLVELAPVTDGADVPGAVLATLGLRERSVVPPAGRGEPAAVDPTDRLVDGLAGKRLLLVLDNCEHLVDAAAKLADRVLGECPQVRILATSREPLGITGEALWPVEPLALPPTGATPAEAMTYASVQLLVDRAGAAQHGFALDATSTPAAIRICRALDGMPLAIELAAARFRALTPDQIAGRLDDRFRLLTGGSRTALPRHQTLRAVVDWSWELLDAPERALLRRLAVFNGGATTEAAERVCAGGPVDPADVPDLLAALVDKSLVVAAGGAPPRYRLLETIKAYSAERLAEAGETDAVRRAHTTHFLALAEAAEPELRRADQLTWLARLTADHDNLQTAVRNALAARDEPIALRLVAALGWYWWLRGHNAEGAELAAQAVALPESGPTQERAIAYAVAAITGAQSGVDREDLVAWFDRAAELTAGLEHPTPLLRLVGPARALAPGTNPGSLSDAVADLHDAYDDPDPWFAAAARLMGGYAMLNHGQQPAEGRRAMREALDGFRAVGDRWGAALALAGCGEAAGLDGDHARAAACYEQSIAATAELGSQEDDAHLRGQLALQLWYLGDRDRALTLAADALAAAERSGTPSGLATAHRTVGELARLDGRLGDARSALERAASYEAPSLVEQIYAVNNVSMGALLLAEGDPVAARPAYAAGLAKGVLSRDAPVLAWVLVRVAEFALAVDQPEYAAALLGALVGVAGLRGMTLPGSAELAAAARSALGEERFAEADRHGRALTWDTLVEYAEPLFRPGAEGHGPRAAR